MASNQIVGDEETYGRFVMTPRHLNEPFISLRNNEKGVSGMILSRFKNTESIEPYRQSLMEKSGQSISDMVSALVKHIRELSIKEVLNVDVILTMNNYPYHAEIRFLNLTENELIKGNTRMSQFTYVCDLIKELLFRTKVTF